jgi:ParB-like chromosome segregation protein Spo0J
MKATTAAATNPPKINQVAVKDLKPSPHNSRTHSPAQIDKIAASIQEFGWTNPILIDAGKNILAGHGRIMAAQKLELEKVPAINLSHLSDAQKRALIIADNQLALDAEWDKNTLKAEIESLLENQFEITLLGFDDADLAELIGFDADEVEMPDLKSGEKDPFQQMTFTLHDEQAEKVTKAMTIAKSMGKFVDSPNKNENGNALARICEIFIKQNGNR